MTETDDDTQEGKTPAKDKRAASKTRAKKGTKRGDKAKRTRLPRIYPALSFEESLALADAIQTYASGEKVSRLTLLKQMNISPTSSASQILITSSGKYGITKGSYAAEYLELTGRKSRRKCVPLSKAKAEATRFRCSSRVSASPSQRRDAV